MRISNICYSGLDPESSLLERCKFMDPESSSGRQLTYRLIFGISDF